MKIELYNGDALEILKTLPDNHIDCCVTSPPYYGLRDYGNDKQIGLEETPQQYIDKLVEVFREFRRVLKPTGTLWLNIGDSYSGSGKGGANYPDNTKGYKQGTNKGMLGAKEVSKSKYDRKRKELLMIPARLAIALSDDGWYLRQDIIWHKPNPMPESVKDRCTKSHEYIFLLSKSEKYYFDHEAIKEPCVGFNNELPAGSKGTLKPNSRIRKGNNKTFRGGGVYTNNQAFNNHTKVEKLSVGNKPNETGLRNKRDVWTISTKPFKGAHFATFPPELAETCLLAGRTKNGIAADIFMGSGTVGVVAKKLNLNFIGIELNKSYCDMASERIAITEQWGGVANGI